VKQWRIVMGMPVTIEIADDGAAAGETLRETDPGHRERHIEEQVDRVFAYLEHVERVFSPFRPTSETSRVKNGLLRLQDCSPEMKTVMRLAEKTRVETDGYFDVYRNGVFNPVGIVKGWAVYQASEMLRAAGIWDFCLDAGGDVQLSGLNNAGECWRVGIRNPFAPREIVKSLSLSDIGVATSGTYARGQHIYDPFAAPGDTIDEIVSLTVLGPNVYEADRFATAAFAMGPQGIEFIERESGLEGYMIDKDGIATMTSGFGEYVSRAA
jgi:thiamine biosynthesis lipoprotein